MAIAKESSKALLFLGIMYNSKTLFTEALEQFCSKYGEVELISEPQNFSQFSSYYNREIGGDVFKSYILFKKPIRRESLAEIKLYTNSLEDQFRDGSLRPINLDPGYLTVDKFVLASAKDFAHRIYIGDGIYAEVTLHFKRDLVKFFSWTYQDYLNPKVEKFLLNGRDYLKKERS